MFLQVFFQGILLDSVMNPQPNNQQILAQCWRFMAKTKHRYYSLITSLTDNCSHFAKDKIKVEVFVLKWV